MRQTGLFPALVKNWRHRRGYSQLDLALAADVSARHVSFLETGRAQPSREMVLRLAGAMSVPLRDQNALLHAAGFAEAYAEPGVERGLGGPVGIAIERMLAHQEPFPMIVMNRLYDVLRANAAATRVLGAMTLEPAAIGPTLNAFRVLFDPRLARPFIVDWEKVAAMMLARLHRESLARPDDGELAALVRELCAYPDVPRSFREPDLTAASEPCLVIRLVRGELELAFLTTVTAFNAPQNVTLDELRLESYFPLDDATRATCERLAKG
jgi:transcriptional regulator with XRE-family HTH domain